MTRTTQHDPEQLDVQAAELAQQLESQRAAARAAREAIEDARYDAERAYWIEEISRFYSEQRPRVEHAWTEFYAALLQGDAEGALAGWITYQKVEGEVRGRYRTLSGRGKQYGIPGMRPQFAIPKRRTFAEAVEAAGREVNEGADAAAAKELAEGSDAAARTAEATARSGQEQPERVTEREPVAVFACEQRPQLMIAAKGDGYLRFRDGVLYTYSDEDAAAVRGREHVVEISEEEAEQMRARQHAGAETFVGAVA